MCYPQNVYSTPTLDLALVYSVSPKACTAILGSILPSLTSDKPEVD